jgi:hypothetical protein
MLPPVPLPGAPLAGADVWIGPKPAPQELFIVVNCLIILGREGPETRPL